MKIRYRKSLKKDIPFINELFRQMIRTVNERMKKEGIKPYEGLDNGYEEGYLDNFYVDNSKVIYVATDEDKVIGFISICNHKDKGYIYLDDYSVNSSYQGKGIGSKLMDLAIEFARSQNIEEIRTHVESANHEAINYYKNKGFVIQNEEEHRLLLNKKIGLEENKKQELIEKNKLIINKVLQEINKKCPNAVDMVAIAGSFCRGNFYEKSDLDLLIMVNDKQGEVISKCYILDGIGQDIYVSYWNRLEQMARYDNYFVTKLKDLNIVYTRNDEVLRKYKSLQGELVNNMADDEQINLNISKYMGKAINIFDKVNSLDSLNDCFVLLGKFMNSIENIIYMMNKSYVVGGTKSIPFEIMNMDILPEDFYDGYIELMECSSKEEIVGKTKEVLDSLLKYFKDNNIEIIRDDKSSSKRIEKQELSKDILDGSYEELFSNYYNKMHYASKINNKYLSLRTMIDAQEFFDEFYESYNMERVRLVEKYDPNNLESNALEFDKCLEAWKRLYEKYGLAILEYQSIDELYNDSLGENDSKKFIC